MGKNVLVWTREEINTILFELIEGMDDNDYTGTIEAITGAAVTPTDEPGKYWLEADSHYNGAFGDLPAFKHPRAVEFAVCTISGRWYTEVVKIPYMDDAEIVAKATDLYIQHGEVKDGVVLAAVYNLNAEE